MEGGQELLQHQDVAVYVEANHLCVLSRGIIDTNSSTITSSCGGAVENEALQKEFLSYIYNHK